MVLRLISFGVLLLQIYLLHLLSEIERQLEEVYRKTAPRQNYLDAPIILFERVSRLLEPNIGIEGSPKGNFLQFLHYDTYEQAISSTTDLVNRSQSLFEEWTSSYRASSGGLKRWYEINIYKVFALRWYSEQLSHHMNEVKLPVEIDTKDLLSYMDGKGFERTSEIALVFAPLVISEYGNLIRENFL